MSKESLKEDARRHEQKEEWPKALDLYLQAIEAQVEGEEPDIALHNRVGDLQIRLGDVDGAVANYEQAIDLYLDVDLPNNAIAICRKIIRNDPKRPAPFLRMGQIRAKQGFVVDARQNYLTYAEMMQARGKTDEALAALEEFVSLIPADIETRVFLAEQLVVRERPDEAVRYLAQACRILVEAGEMDRAHELQARIEQIAPGHALPSMMLDREQEVPEEEIGGLVGFETTSLGVAEASLEVTEAPAAGLSDEEEAAGDFAFGEIALSDEPAEDDAPLPIFDDVGPVIEGVEADAEVEEAGDPGVVDFSLQYEGESEDDESAAPDLPLLTFGDEDETQEGDGEDVGTELPVFASEVSEVVEGAMQEAADPAPDSLAAQGRRLLAAGDEEGGTEALERAHVAFARIGEAPKAIDVVRTLLGARPDRLELRQLLVDYAYQSNDESLLVQALLDLGDALSESGKQPRAEAVYRQVLTFDAKNARARAALEAGTAPLVAKPAPPPPPPPPPPAPARQRDDEYVDLGSLVLEGDEAKSTRWVVAAGTPSGDEAADFARMLSQFKDKVAQNLSSDDAKAHYDLGTAYKEMGLLDEAIEEFQRSLRADPKSLGAFEMLGQCFLDKGEPAVAIRTLERGMKLPTLVEDDLLGVYYYLGKANESIGNSTQARDFYEKIFSLDINFKDVTDRLRALR